MGVYEILNSTKKKVINRIIADLAFVEANYPGFYRDVTPEPVIEAEKESVKTIEEKVDELSAKLDQLTISMDAIANSAAVKP